MRLGPVRRTRFLACDVQTTCWDGWDSVRGARVRLRVVRGEYAEDPAALDTLRSVAHGAGLPVRLERAGRPHLVTAPFLRTLGDLWPLDEPLDPDTAVAIVVGALAALLQIHARGATHGKVDPDHLVLGDHGWTLLSLGEAEGTLSGDLLDLASIATTLAVGDPVCELIADFAEHPPPSTADAAALVRRTLAAQLAAARHHLLARSRGHDLHARASRLRGLAHRLATFPPPPAIGCVHAPAQGDPHWLVSDGTTVTGGPGPEPRNLDLLATAGHLETAAVRAILRAWALREIGAPERRREATLEARGSDEALARLTRWLAASSRLRVDRRLLEER